jgi:hypothetical protein
MGRTYTPRRDELAEALCDLIPATEDEAHTGVEIRTGEGWLSEAIPRRYPNVRMIGLDGSETMLRATAARITPLGGCVELRQIRLEEPGWVTALPDGLRCTVGSLVIHHLDGRARRRSSASCTPSWRRAGAPDLRSGRAGERFGPAPPGAGLERRGRAAVALDRRRRPRPSPVRRRPMELLRISRIGGGHRPPLDDGRAASVVGGDRLYRG